MPLELVEMPFVHDVHVCSCTNGGNCSLTERLLLLEELLVRRLPLTGVLAAASESSVANLW